MIIGLFQARWRNSVEVCTHFYTYYHITLIPLSDDTVKQSSPEGEYGIPLCHVRASKG